jgi:hypothetical protein
VTWPEPELDDGALDWLKPFELELLPELPELLELLELPELVELPDDFDDEPDECAEPEECCVVEAAWLEPGRVTATAPAASTPAAPAAAVSRRSRRWFQFLAAIATWRDR